MNLVDYLDPTSALPHSNGLRGTSSFYSNLIIFNPGKPFPEIGPEDIIIIGVPESRNSFNPSASKAPDAIRKYLYGLSASTYKTRIIDGGNLKFTKTPTDTYAALKDIIEFISQKNARTVVLGGTQELTLPIFEVLSKNQTSISVAIIDSKFDIGEDNDFNSTGYIQTFIGQPLDNLLNLSLIGYQGYLCNNGHIDLLSSSNHEPLRLGFVRGSMQEVEPTIRDSSIVSLDMGAIRNSDCPGNITPSPNGFYAEEICQLARFAGISSLNNVFGVFEYCQEKDSDGQSAHLASQIVWHYIEASGQKKKSFQHHLDKELKKFLVNIGTKEDELVFYKSLISDQWWVEVYSNHKKSIQTSKKIISCSYNDYLLASKQEIPERWFRFFKKFS